MDRQLRIICPTHSFLDEEQIDELGVGLVKCVEANDEHQRLLSISSLAGATHAIQKTRILTFVVT